LTIQTNFNLSGEIDKTVQKYVSTTVLSNQKEMKN